MSRGRPATAMGCTEFGFAALQLARVRAQPGEAGRVADFEWRCVAKLPGRVAGGAQHKQGRNVRSGTSSGNEGEQE